MHKLIKGLAALGAMTMAASVWAAGIPLYQAPNTESKVATQVEAGTHLIPIYRSNEHRGWVKVANPRDGQVGWLRIEQPKLKWVQKPAAAPKKQPAAMPALKLQPAKPAKVAQTKSAAEGSHKQLKNASKAQAEGFVQRVVTTDEGNGPKRYQVIEYSGPQRLSDKQIQQVIRNMERRNMQMQRDMQRMMDDMQRNFFGFQPIMPPTERIVVVPAQVQAQDAPAASDKAAVTAQKPAKPSFWQKIKDKVSH